MTPTVLDLFSGAAGGWSLGMHRAGFRTVAACEAIAWRRALYAENNPGVKIYDDVCTLTAERLVRDLRWLPDAIVGSPPCQDISSANTKGQGVDGDRSKLYFEAVRLVDECRPRWFSFENSANLRTRGADRIIAAIQAIGYAVEISVVGADDVKANHERKRSWLVGYDPDQVTHAGSWEQWQQSGWWHGANRAYPVLDGCHDQAIYDPDPAGLGRSSWPGFARSDERHQPADIFALDPESFRHEIWRPWRYGADGLCSAPAAQCARDAPHADQAGQADGCLVSCLRQAEIAIHGCCDQRRDDVAYADSDGQSDSPIDAEMGGSKSSGGDAPEPWSDWNGGLAGHLRVDDGVSAQVASTRIAIGGPRGVTAASLIVEAFGDAVVPQITEAIGRSILRTDAALRAVYGSPLSSHNRSITGDSNG